MDPQVRILYLPLFGKGECLIFIYKIKPNSMYSCKKCEFITESNSDIANHYKYKHSDRQTYKCDKCSREIKSKGGMANHLKKCKGPKVDKSKTCEKCNFIIKKNFEKHFNYCDGRGPRRSRPKIGQGWSKGLTKFTDDRVMNISKGMKDSDYVYKPHRHTEETKILLSKIMNHRYENGWESTAGRCKKLDYESPIAGKIKVDGNWELRVAIYLDRLGVNWSRNKKRFEYFNTLKNKKSTYCPDFYVDDWSTFIEVKGYKTELDEIKWRQFSYNLEIWDKEKLIYLGIDVKYRKNRTVL